MSSLQSTFAALRRSRAQAAGLNKTGSGPDRLIEIKEFGANPGALRAFVHVPKNLPAKAALVVVLHGCTQTARDYDTGSGWSSLADSAGFAVLYPQQERSNNPNLCFSWFDPGDAARGSGETASIIAMIDQIVAAHHLDPARIYVTGLSAGGAMAATLLACHPETFSAGAIIAGLPHGVARSIPDAFKIMKGRGLPDVAELVRIAREASSDKGPWPRVSIWQGEADTTVAPANAKAIAAQWRGIHGLAAKPSETMRVDNAHRSIWRDAEGRDAVELWAIPGFAHGTPIAPAKDGLGRPMPYMLAQDISSTASIAQFFGLAGSLTERVAGTVEAKLASPPTLPPHQEEPTRSGIAARVELALDRALPGRVGVNGMIKSTVERALRSAGLR